MARQLASYWYVDGHFACVRLVEADAKVALTTEKKQDKDAYVNEADLG